MQEVHNLFATINMLPDTRMYLFSGIEDMSRNGYLLALLLNILSFYATQIYPIEITLIMVPKSRFRRRVSVFREYRELHGSESMAVVQSASRGETTVAASNLLARRQRLCVGLYVAWYTAY